MERNCGRSPALASLAATCLASSRATSRTGTLVATAHTAPVQVPAHADIHLLHGPCRRRPIWKQRPMNILGRKAPGAMAPTCIEPSSIVDIRLSNFLSRCRRRRRGSA